MCQRMSIAHIASLCLLVSAVIAAPVEKAAPVSASKRSVNAPVEDVAHQDEDLQDLLNLVNKQASQDDVMVHKEEVTHFENNNGNTIRVNEEEEKVVDTKTGDVIADVKQEVKEQASAGQQEPETVVETKVDIPTEGVHQTFVQGDSQDPASDVSNSEEALPSNEDANEDDLTPADMAEYLFFTQQFNEFFAGLDRLVNQSKMTVEEATSYAKEVADEYERLQIQSSSFYEDAPLAQLPPGPDNYVPTEFMPETYPPVDFQRPARGYMSPEEEQFLYESQPQQDFMPQLEDSEDIDPYDFLAALWAEAYGKGNPEALDIVRMLYDRVSHDDNPDDMGQIKEILLETAAASLSENPFPFDTEQMDLGMPPQADYQIPNGPRQLLNTPIVDNAPAQLLNAPVADSAPAQPQEEVSLEDSQSDGEKSEVVEEEESKEEESNPVDNTKEEEVDSTAEQDTQKQ